MKRSSLFVALALVPLISVAQAARVKLPDFSGLADKAKESVDISLDRDMLRTAGAFMGGGRPDDREFQQLVEGLDGIYVKVFEFDKPDMYSARDIEAVVRQVESDGWKKLMSVREKDERVEMWMRDNSTEGGMFFVASEPTELVLINIVGKVNLETLRRLQGRMGVPAIPGVPPPPPPPPARGATPAAPAAPAAPVAPR